MSNNNQNSSEASASEVFEQASGASASQQALTLTMTPRVLGNIVNGLSSKVDKDAGTIDALYRIVEEFAKENSDLRDQLKFAGDEIQSGHEVLRRAYKAQDDMQMLLESYAEENIELSNLLMQEKVDNTEYAQWAESERKTLRDIAQDLEQELQSATLAIASLQADLAEQNKKLTKLTQENLELSRANHSGQLSQGDTFAQLDELGKELIAVTQENNSLHIENDVLAAATMRMDEQIRMLREELAAAVGLEGLEDTYPDGYPDEMIPKSALEQDLEQAFLEEDGLLIEDELDVYMEWLEKNAAVPSEEQMTDEQFRAGRMIH